jgi:hypothetical protein
MDTIWKTPTWNQFGAAIDSLDNAIIACPDSVWNLHARPIEQQCWYLVFHTLFWLDFYLSESTEGFTPPAPFTLGEMDPAGVYPDRAYSKDEMRTYLEHGRNKCRSRIAAMTNESAARRFKFGSLDLGAFELLLYTMRHVQHHAAQLNLILRQETDSAPRWVRAAKSKLDEE